MATTNHERVGKALELLKAGLGPFVDREIQTAVRAQRIDAATLRRFVDNPLIGNKPATEWDGSILPVINRAEDKVGRRRPARSSCQAQTLAST